MTADALQRLGIAVTPKSFDLLTGYVHELLAENQRINLTGARTADALWEAHVCDSLSLLPLLEQRNTASLLDLGSGGGLPGVPLACVRPDLQVTLLDSTRKKIDAVRHICERVELANVDFVWARAEVAAHDTALRERFDLVTARAVADLSVLIELAAGFARVGGLLAFFKSVRGAEAEVPAAARTARACGLELARIERYALPGAHGERALALYHKTARLRADLPRPMERLRGAPL
jgi:16S rRNA (guanine527-N7)-methyltransferase